jgi:hypothetical protein
MTKYELDMAGVDYIEVGRTAHELSKRMGWIIAPKYAARLAEEALANGRVEEYEFWRAVELALTIRSTPPALGTQI